VATVAGYIVALVVGCVYGGVDGMGKEEHHRKQDYRYPADMYLNMKKMHQVFFTDGEIHVFRYG